MNKKTGRTLFSLITPFIAAFILGWMTVGWTHAQAVTNQVPISLTDERTVLFPPLAPDTVYVSGVITQSTTWTAVSSPYVVNGSVTIPAGVTLTVEPGVVVKFDNGHTLNVNGQLLAQLYFPLKILT